LKSGHFRSAEEVIAKALVALRDKERSSVAADSNGRHDDAVREMLNFVEANRTPLKGISVKQLIHDPKPPGHPPMTQRSWGSRIDLDPVAP